jgi:hypothetical protein
MDPNLLIAIVIVALLAVVGVVLLRRNRSKHLEEKFGPEYRRAVHTLGGRGKAEAELAEREKRVKSLHIVPLAPQDAARFRDQWNELQARFVDNPKGVLAEADRLVCDLMQKRGYPMGDFQRNAADISVDHPRVVEHYRAAHDIALRDHRGEADTEMMRQAVVHYRALFADLLETGPAERIDERRETRERKPLFSREPIAAARDPRDGDLRPNNPRERR